VLELARGGSAGVAADDGIGADDEDALANAQAKDADAAAGLARGTGTDPKERTLCKLWRKVYARAGVDDHGNAVGEQGLVKDPALFAVAAAQCDLFPVLSDAVLVDDDDGAAAGGVDGAPVEQAK